MREATIIPVGLVGRAQGNNMPFLDNVKTKYQGLGLVASIFSFFQGRATFFAIFFTIVGTVLAFKNELTGTFVAFVGAIQSLVVGHSLKEDYFERKRKDDDTK